MTAAQNNSIMSQINSPQAHIQPPQNPLIAMTNLSTSPLSVGSTSTHQQQMHKENIEQRNAVSSGLSAQFVQHTPPVQNTSGDTNNATQTQAANNASHTSSSPAKMNVSKTATEGKF